MKTINKMNKINKESMNMDENTFWRLLKEKGWDVFSEIKYIENNKLEFHLDCMECRLEILLHNKDLQIRESFKTEYKEEDDDLMVESEMLKSVYENLMFYRESLVNENN
jgi:hypothetical protein